jgi:MFS family permease
MWELYSMWTWAPLCLLASYEAAGWSTVGARMAGFATVAAGALGAFVAGIAADRFGRTATTMIALAVSGACALVAGALFHAPLALTVVCLVWGVSVVADSAQFSAAVSELAERAYVGTALTLQTCLGFLLTLVTIRGTAALESRFGWPAAFAVLALGPIFGIWSMAALRRMPEARAMAGGKK